MVLNLTQKYHCTTVNVNQGGKSVQERMCILIAYNLRAYNWVFGITEIQCLPESTGIEY